MNRTNSLTILLVSAPLLLLAGCGAPYDLPCVYAGAETPEDPTPELSEHPGCASVDPDRRPRIAPRHLAAAHYEDGLAALHIAGDWHYVRPDGTSLRVIAYDNGPDSWAEGLVRSRRDGKIVYVNRAFEVAIPPRYDWGWPYEDGRALVCIGCRLGDSAGEHHPVVDGHWGYIDHSGAEVVPVRFSRSEALEIARERSGEKVP